MIQKLTSRKLWMAIAGVAVGIATILGVEGSDVSTVAGAVTSIASIITYIVTEGKIDAAAVGKIKDTVDQVTGAIDAIENVGE